MYRKALFLFLLTLFSFSSFGCVENPYGYLKPFHWDGAQDCVDAWMDLKRSVDEYNDKASWQGGIPPNGSHPCENWFNNGVACEFDEPSVEDLANMDDRLLYGGTTCNCLITQVVCDLGLDEIIEGLCDEVCLEQIAYFERWNQAGLDADIILPGASEFAFNTL